MKESKDEVMYQPTRANKLSYNSAAAVWNLDPYEHCDHCDIRLQECEFDADADCGEDGFFDCSRRVCRACEQNEQNS